MQRIVANASSTGNGAACWTAELDEETINSDDSSELLAKDFGIAAIDGETYYVVSQKRGLVPLILKSAENIRGPLLSKPVLMLELA